MSLKYKQISATHQKIYSINNDAQFFVPFELSRDLILKALSNTKN
jgi:hypothetical protein